MQDKRKLQGWWAHKQGLDGSFQGQTPSAALARAGWARSVGGVNPYLTFYARAGTSRQEADKAVADVIIHELPSARGCTYVVPAEHFALALRLGRGSDDAGEMGSATKFLGVTVEEIERLSERIVDAVAKAPLDPKEIKDAVGDAVRNLGEEGKKRGITTTLPLALGRLQSRGAIRRVSTNGRLDNQRYAYVGWTPNPLASTPIDYREACRQFAELFFEWIGPASLAEFRWVSGLGVQAAKEAVADLRLVSAPGESELLIREQDADAFEAFVPSEEPCYRLVGSIDGITHLRRDVASLLDDSDVSRPMMGERGAKAIGGVVDLSSHAIFDRGRLVGLWEYDPGAQSIAWCSFVPPSGALEREVARTEAFVRDELGDARSFSLDSPESRAPRIEAIRAAQLAFA